MNPFPYSDDQISETELMIAIPSIIIGVGILTLPADVASVTLFSDGWISILLAGILFTFLAIIGVKLAAFFPDQSFLSYTSYLVTRPVATIIAFIYILTAILLTSFSVRSVAYMSQQYLFNHTPMNVLALCFLLVVVYAVSGSRAGIFRLNMLFLPIILVSFIFVGILNIEWLNSANFFPMFKSDATDYLKGMVNASQAFIGFGIGLFYVVFIKKPTNRLTKKVAIGMSIPIAYYIMIFLFNIGVFGNAVTSNLEFPTIELAKHVDIPGGIFERIDALVFTIWMMAIFNTAAMILDVCVHLLSSIFKKMEKKIITFILSPIIFYFVFFLGEIEQIKATVSIVSQFFVYFTSGLIISLFLIAKIRGVKSHDKK